MLGSDTTTGTLSFWLRQHQLSAAESVTNSRFAVEGAIVRPLLLVARLSVCAQRHMT
jgi:hypothetical protein